MSSARIARNKSMPRLTNRQYNVLYNNARRLGLDYADERWLLEDAYDIDMDEDDGKALVGAIFNYIGADNVNPEKRKLLTMEAMQGRIKFIIQRYKK